MKYVLLVLVLAISGCSTPQFKFTKDAETVVLLHGFGRSNFATRNLAEKINNAGYNVIPVEYDSMNQNIDSVKKEITKKIDACCANQSSKVHFVGHSMGGLLIRYYLGERRIENLGNVVLIGTPNKGTPVVDYYKDEWWFFIFGDSVMALSAEKSTFLKNLKKPYYKTGVIAGSVNQGFLDDILTGKGDGIVPLKSTVLEGMTDYIVLDVNHGRMRHSEKVTTQMLHFLKNDKFKGT